MSPTSNVNLAPLGRLALGAIALTLIACSADRIVTSRAIVATHPVPADALSEVQCTAHVRELTVTCASDNTSAPSGGASRDIFGKQGQYVQLQQSNFSYNAGTGLFQFDVAIQNLLNESIGTPNGVIVDTADVKIFFFTAPVVTAGTGTITIDNEDGTGNFSAAGQDFYRYPGILAKNVTSAPKTWKFTVPPTVASFTFSVYVDASTQILLVINEILTNPGGTILDANGEWFELYNAGSRPIDLRGLIVRDSAASGIRPPHEVATSVVVAPGGYTVLGNTTNTTNNGGVNVVYAYGNVLAFTNSLDALRIERVFRGDSLVIDGVSYANASISAVNGVSRELINPRLDNTNLDGSNWVMGTVVYGPGGAGTPGAQNTGFVP